MQRKIKGQKCLKHIESEDSSVTLVNLSKTSEMPSLTCPLCMDEEENEKKQFYISVNRFSKIQSFYKGINDKDTQKKLHELEYIREQCNKIFDKMREEIILESHSSELAEKEGLNLEAQGTKLEEKMKKQIHSFNEQYLDLEKSFKANKMEKTIDDEIRKKYFSQNNGVKVINKALTKTEKSMKQRIRENHEMDMFIAKWKSEEKLNILKRIPNLKSFFERISYETSIFARQMNLNTKYLTNSLIIELTNYKWKYLEKFSLYDQNPTPLFDEFLNIQDIIQIKEISLHAVAGTEKISKFAWKNLKRLFINKANMDKNGVNELFKGKNLFNNLEIFVFKSATSSMTPQHMKELNGLAQNLLVLSLMNLSIKKQQLTALLENDKWNNLKHLDLSGNGIEIEGLEVIIEYHWRKLKILKLSQNKLHNKSASLIARRDWKCLEELDLSKNRIRIGGALELVEKQWNHFTSINLKKNQVNLKLWGKKKKFMKKKVNAKIKFGQNQKSDATDVEMVEHALVVENEETNKKQIKFQVKDDATMQNSRQNFVKEVKEVFDKIDVLYNSDPVITTQLCENILNTTTTPSQVQESKEIFDNLVEETKNSDDCLATILVGMKDSYESQGGSFLISKSSTLKSQLSTKILTSGFMEDQVKFTEHLEETQEWKFAQIVKNEAKREEFKSWYVKKIAKEYNIDEKEVIIHKLVEGSIAVQWSSANASNTLNVLQANVSNQKLKVHRFFQTFSLSPDDFDPKGNIQFSSSPSKNEKRGGWPYYQPVFCKRYGLKVSGKYDNGNDLWLGMDGKPGEWAVAFHGVSSPASSCRNTKVLNCIMEGLDKGQMLIAGAGQAYQNRPSLNFPSVNVGKGIYCSPHFQVCLSQYSSSVTVQGKNYHLILQCRVNPKKIKVCPNHTYWVINDSKDIRPYGILLVKSDVKSQIASPSQLFGSDFQWGNVKNQVESYLASCP